MWTTKVSDALRRVMLAGLSLGVSLCLVCTVSADSSSEGVWLILPAELVAELTENCDMNEIYEQAWEQIVASLSDEEFASCSDILREEVTEILLTCLEKKLAEFDCDKMTCDDLDDGLKRLRDIGTDYFYGRFMDIATAELYPGSRVAAWIEYQAKLLACYRSVFAACDCNLEGLLTLRVDLVLDESNPLEGGRRMELADEVLAKYEECLIEDIATMTNVYEMARLIFEEEIDKPYSVVKGNTIYNNYTIACAILKRLIELYDLDADDVDRYLCSPCCDTVWLLEWLLGWIDEYNLMGYPERDWREWSDWDQDNLIDFIRHMRRAGDLYTLCRKHALDEATAECDPNAFCTLLKCGDQSEGYEQSIRTQLADPREKAFLEALEARLEECLGSEVEFEDIIKWCTTEPLQKTWDTLKPPEPAIPEETRSCAEDLGEASGTDYKNSGFTRYRVSASKRLSFFREEIEAYLTCSRLGACARMAKAWLDQAPLELQKELAEIFWDSFEDANR